MQGGSMDDDALQRVYQWVDEIPLSRPKRNIARDFSDGLLTAEIVAHYFPRIIELHNYPAANAYAQKNYNWNTLNSKVFKKMGLQLNKEEIDALCNCTAQAIERTLSKLQEAMSRYGKKQSEAPQESAREQKPYKPPAKPTPRAPTVARAPMDHRTKAAAPAEPNDATQLLLAEKDSQLVELQETVDILEVKIQKLEQLVRLKDSKIATLQAKLQQSGMQ